jgi:hypothetical protein
VIIEFLVVIATLASIGVFEFIREKIGEFRGKNEVDVYYEPTETDTDLIEKTREIIESHFPDGVESTMLALSTEARVEKVKKITLDIVEAYDIEVDTLTFFGNKQMEEEGMDGLMAGYFSASNKSIALNADLLAVDNGELLKEMINTIVHECRHAFQHKAIECPEQCGVDSSVALEWMENFVKYISPELDPFGYYYQPVEFDARNFTTLVLDGL